MKKPFECGCGKRFTTEQGRDQHMSDMRHTMDTPKRRTVRRNTFTPETDPDWSVSCDVCGSSPVVPVSGMCGPCTFGEADTVAGNW